MFPVSGHAGISVIFTDFSPRLGVGADALRQDLPAAGLHFESLVMRDIQVCAQPIAGTPSSWRDSQTGLEVDAVLELPDGRWACFHKPLVDSIDQK